MKENKEQLKIEDESGDRKYFTIIPNYILNHSTAITQALYLQLKRLAGENGVAYPSSKYLTKQLNICRNTLKKEFKYLLEKGWIKYNGEKEIETKGGSQKIKSYKIIDIWEINSSFYKRGVKKRHTLNERGVKIVSKGVSSRGVKIDDKEEPSEEELKIKKNNMSAKPTVWNFSSKLEEMKQDKRRHINIIALYWAFKTIQPQNKEQYSALLKRELKPAKELVGFSDEKILEVMDWLENENTIKWTVETILKFISEDLGNIDPIKRKKYGNY